MVGILYHDDYLIHNTGIGHPERPGRVTVITEALKKSNFADKLIWDTPRLALEEEIAYVHGKSYIEHVKSASEAGQQYLDSPDTLVSKGSFTAALRAAGAVMTGIDNILGGKYNARFLSCASSGTSLPLFYGYGFLHF